MVTAEQFVERYPKLWHMAELGSHSSIFQHGLLSTEALLDLFEIQGDQRHALLRHHRRESVTICHPEHGKAVVRDQKPMNSTTLTKCLTDMTPEEWYAHLNKRVFFWVNEARLEKMLRAGAYREREHTVLELSTAGLLGKHIDDVALSPMNSGATFPMGATPRGSQTFLPLATYPWENRIERGLEPVVELAVDYRVPDVEPFLLDVSTRTAEPED